MLSLSLVVFVCCESLHLVCVWSTEFESSEGKHTALTSSEDLWKENYLTCPSLTPPHLSSWVSMTTPATPINAGGEEREKAGMHSSPQVKK